MSLNSLAFLLGFLPLVVIGVHLLRDYRSARSAQVWVLVASLAFYARDGVRNVPILLAAILFNWAIARGMDSERTSPAGRKRLFVAGLTVDVFILFAYKYLPILVEGIGHLAGRDIGRVQLGFPLGLSFFMLTQIMYLVDCYQRIVRANSLFDHATFVAFFPNITAGPLVRAKHLVSQFVRLGDPESRDERLARGIALIAIGLFKKVVLGDSFARIADAGYGDVGGLSTMAAWITALAYSFQIYFDFSGYSDMAFGIGRLLGVSLVRNFNAPFRSVNIGDFWQRWHISLSTFITTYLFTPLIRSMGRVTIHKAALATLTAMTLVGIWHGASWRFILFYGLHGAALAGYQYWKRRKTPLPRRLAVVTTFGFVTLAFIVFRAPNIATALTLAGHLLPSGDIFGNAVFGAAMSRAEMKIITLPLIGGAVFAFVGPTSDEIAERFPLSLPAGMGIIVIALVSFLFMSANTGSAFIYRAF